MAIPGEQQSLEVPPPRDLGLLAVAIVGVSASGPLMAAAAAPALAIAFWRNALGAGLTGLVSLRNWREFATIERRTFALAAMGGIFLALHFGTWVPSVKYTSVASATALVATQAIFSAIIAASRGLRLPRVAWIGMVLAILGTAFIAGADFGVSTRALVGDGLAVAGGLFAAAYVSVGSVARRTMSVVTYTTVCYGVCSAGLLFVCLVGGQSLSGYSTRAWVLIAGVTVCAQLFGHTLINVVLRSASTTFVGLAILLETPGAAIIAAIWLHQTPSAWAIPGLVLLFGGLVITIRAKSVVELATADVD